MNLRSGRLKTEMTDEAAEYTSSLEFDKIIFELKPILHIL